MTERKCIMDSKYIATSNSRNMYLKVVESYLLARGMIWQF